MKSLLRLVPLVLTRIPLPSLAPLVISASLASFAVADLATEFSSPPDAILVLPNLRTMTPETLGVIDRLVKQGATVVGNPPEKLPGLENHPTCDTEVAGLATEMWQGSASPSRIARIGRGKGAIYKENEQTMASRISAKFVSLRNF